MKRTAKFAPIIGDNSKLRTIASPWHDSNRKPLEQPGTAWVSWRSKDPTAALLIAMFMAFAAFPVRSQVVVLGAQYQPDIPYNEFDCIWNDRNYPTNCPSRALGCNVHVFLKNTGASAVTINDVTVAGYSLNTVLKENANVHYARSIYFYWDNPPQNILDAGEPVWYKGDPKTIPAGGVGKAVVRLRTPPVTPTVAVGVATSAGTVTTNITKDVNAAQLASVGFSQDRTKVYLHWRRPGGAAPTTIRLNGNDVTALTTTVGDPGMNFAASVIHLTSPLAYMSYNVFQGVYADGKTATASLRTFAHPFVHATWGTFPYAGNSTADAQTWINEATMRGINTGENQGLGGALGSYLNTSAGRAYADARGGYRLIVWNKSTSNDPLMGFTNDEPDAEEANMERTFCNTGLNLPCGKSPMGILVMREIGVGEDYRNTFPNTATTVNINGTFRPENYYAWGQSMDVLQVDPYYQRRLQDVYWRDQHRIPLYRKATYIYAVAKATTTAAEPNRSLIILYSCEWRCQNSGACDPEYLNQTWPFPTPESKRIEAYYSLAAGAKGLSYWWFNTGYPSNGLGDQSKPTARALWKEMGVYGNEIKTVSDLLVTSHPVDLPLTPGPNVWAKALAVGTDTLMLIVVNDNYYNDIAGCHYTNVTNATLTATLPAWMQGSPSAFEVTAGGLLDVSTQVSGSQLQVNLGTLRLTKMIVVTKDPTLRASIQQRYDQQVRANVCAFAPELCVNNPPAIATQPVNRAVPAGDPATFTVVATGTSPLSYRWQKNNVNLNNGGHYSGATTATLTISNTDSNDAAGYRCVITNAFGSVTSSVATLTLTVPGAPPAPTALAATGLANFGFTANWVGVGGATGYRLDVATDNGFNNYVTGYQDLDVGNVTSRNVTGLPPGATYYYRVRSYNAVGSSTNSGTITVVLTVTIADTCFGVVNAGFEDGFSSQGGGLIGNNWTEWEASPGVAVGYAETTIKRSGNSSQRIRVWGAGGTSGGVYQRLSVIPGQLYTVSVWIYAGDALSQCSLGVDPGGGTSPNAAEVQWSAATTNVAWVQRTWVGTATADYLTIFYRVASSDSTQRNGYFDDATPAGVLTGPRQLLAERSGNSVSLSWPACLTAQLQRASSLTPPVSWAPATNQVSIVGSQKRVTVAPAGSGGYFRIVLE